jgi:hypothetical protein
MQMASRRAVESVPKSSAAGWRRASRVRYSASREAIEKRRRR